jgi:hypothetical protein
LTFFNHFSIRSALPCLHTEADQAIGRGRAADLPNASREIRRLRGRESGAVGEAARERGGGARLRWRWRGEEEEAQRLLRRGGEVEGGGGAERKNRGGGGNGGASYKPEVVRERERLNRLGHGLVH